MYFSECPRCGANSYEKLSSHNYCVECNFSPDEAKRDEDFAIPEWALNFLKERNENGLMEKLVAESGA